MDRLSIRLDTKPAAKHCGLSPRTLEKYRSHGGGPVYYKLGRRVVYDTADLDAWLQKRRRRSTADIGQVA